MNAYPLLVAVALLANLRDARRLALAAVVGAGVMVPVPAANFYLICALGEILIALIALNLDVAATRPIVRISTLLVSCHAMGYLFNGYPLLSPYHLAVKLCEHAELLVCIWFSPPLTRRFTRA